MEGSGRDPMRSCPPVEEDEDIPDGDASWRSDDATSLADTDVEEGDEEEASEVSSLASVEVQHEASAGPDLPAAGEPRSMDPRASDGTGG